MTPVAQTGDSNQSDFDDLRMRIAETDSGLPKRLAQAAEYALREPDEIAFGTAASIASAAGVQPSTLVRLARHLGYNGFSDMQMVFRNRLRSRASTYEERLENLEQRTDFDSLETSIVAGFLEAARESLLALHTNIDAAALKKGVRELAKADTIYLLANRRAYPLAAHMSYVLSRLAIRNHVISTPNGIDDELTAMVRKNDAVIACSFSPYAGETVRHVEQLAERKIPIVAITDTALSPIATRAVCWIEVAEADFAGFRSLSASMAIASALPVAIAEKRRLKQ
jgi:DNA-binding MurR/RpiR family transcriptional regulator